jgi:hypothetical protein
MRVVREAAVAMRCRRSLAVMVEVAVVAFEAAVPSSPRWGCWSPIDVENPTSRSYREPFMRAELKATSKGKAVSSTMAGVIQSKRKAR